MNMLDDTCKLKRRLQEKIDKQKPIGKPNVILSAVFLLQKKHDDSNQNDYGNCRRNSKWF